MFLSVTKFKDESKIFSGQRQDAPYFSSPSIRSTITNTRNDAMLQIKPYQICSILLITFVASSSYANEMDEKIAKLLSVNETFRTPDQMLTAVHVGAFLLEAELINKFPFGDDQVAYISSNKIKSIVLNYRVMSESGDIENSPHFSQKISFNPDGRVKSIDRTTGKSRIMSSEYSYQNNIISKLVCLEGPQNNFHTEVRFSVQPHITFDLLNGPNRDHSVSVKFDDETTLTYSRGYSLEGLDSTYEYSNTSLVGIKHSYRFNGESAIATSMISPPAPRSVSVKSSVVGGLHSHFHAAMSEHIFERGDNNLTETRFMRAAGDGRIYGKAQASYRWTDAQVEALTVTRERNPEPISPSGSKSSNVWIISRNNGGTVEGIFDSENIHKHGVLATRIDGRLSKLEIGRNRHGYSTGFVRGAYSLKYNGTGKFYRAELWSDELKKKMVATLDSELTDYY